MTTKQLKSVGSDDIDDFSSVYTDDFETDSPPPSPDNRYKTRRTSNDKTTESDASSFSGYRKPYNHGKTQKVYPSKLKAGKTGLKSTGLKSGKKNPSPVKPDIVQTRMLSAQRSRINTLNNELGEMNNKLEELIKENKLLKKLQFRQEKSLRKFENKDGDIPRLITQYEEDQRVLKAKLRKSQEAERALETKVRESNDEIQKLEHSVQRLKKLVDDKNLGERSELTKQLNYSQDRLFDCEKKSSEMEKKLELNTQSFTRQLHGEKAKHGETREKLKLLQQKLDDFETRLKEKDRALQVSNIYSLRARQNLEKAAVNFKTTQTSSRKSPKKSDQDLMPTQPLSNQPISQVPMPTTNDKPLSAGSTVSAEDISIRSSSSESLIGSPQVTSLSQRDGSAKSGGDVANNLNDLRLHNGANEKEPEKEILSFKKSDKSYNGTPSSPSSQDSAATRSPMLREKSFTIASKSAKQKEDNLGKKTEEEEKKKAALLSRMKHVDEASDVTTATLTGAELRNLLDGPPTQKPIMHHKKSVDGTSMANHLNKAPHGHENEDDLGLTFGGYAPTVTSAPKRRLQSRIPAATDSDKPMLDLNSGKSKNNDLLQQLFGDNAAKPSSNERLKKNSFNSTKSALPKATALVTPHRNGSGDVMKQQRKDDVIKNHTSKTVTPTADDDIEELSL